jgi:hypothetical protein
VARVSRSTLIPSRRLVADFSYFCLGTQRRTKKAHTNENAVSVDKKISTTIKKLGKTSPILYVVLIWLFFRLGVQPLNDIDEVNMFKDDATIVHFRKPMSKFFTVKSERFSNGVFSSPILRAREPFGRHWQW